MLDALELILGRRVTCRIKEDNQATIAVIKSGYSQKLAPMLRSQRVNLGALHEGIEDNNGIIDYVESAK